MRPEFEQCGTISQDPEAAQTVDRVAAQVLETMFFTEAELSTCDHFWLEIADCARVQFEGSHFGEMQLGISANAADPIAAAFLGLDEHPSKAQLGEVIQELANVLCGAMLSQLWPDSKLALASPQSTLWHDWDLHNMLHRCFAIPEGMLAISIRLNSQPPANEPQ